MSSDRVVRYSQPTYAPGPNGTMACTGVVAYRSTPPRNTMHLVALDTQGHASQYYLEIPIEDIPKLVEALQSFHTG